VRHRLELGAKIEVVLQELAEEYSAVALERDLEFSVGEPRLACREEVNEPW
jgi:hypothetical protein